MIKRITRKNLDLDKYTDCLNKAINYRIYAEFWYLDIVTKNRWDCYVYNDYEAIMPVPFIKKMGLKIISQPIYCQQLGVFHQENFKKNQFDEFLNKLRFRLVNGYHFNEENTINFNPKGQKLVNQSLKINSNNYANYSKMTKRNVKRFNQENLQLKANNNISELIKFKQIHSNQNKYINLFEELLYELEKRNSLSILNVENDSILGFTCYILSKNRIIYLNSATTLDGKQKRVPTGLIDKILNQNEEKILDFEGSSIPSIQNFFKGFGAEISYYTAYKNI